MTVRMSASPLLLAIVVFALPCIGKAQNSTPPADTSPAAPASQAAPRYDSDADINRIQSSAFNTPEADGRPGEYYFGLGVQAVKRKDYAHAIKMYQVAASWAYKPAEYNLGVMYLSGQGAPVDQPRALAWMALAAERNDPQYVKARNLINGHLTDAQFKQANVILSQLAPTYSDKVALVRAKARWSEVRASITGSRVGSAAGHVEVGGIGGATNHMQSPNYDVHGGGHTSTNAAEVAGVYQTDGAIAYQQLRESNNPYDPKFEKHPDATGTVTVEPLIPVKKEEAVNAKKSADPGAAGAGNPS